MKLKEHLKTGNLPLILELFLSKLAKENQEITEFWGRDDEVNKKPCFCTIMSIKMRRFKIYIVEE